MVGEGINSAIDRSQPPAYGSVKVRSCTGELVCCVGSDSDGRGLYFSDELLDDGGADT